MDRSPAAALAAIDAELRTLREAMIAAAASRSDDVAAVHPTHRRSAENLLHYVELRRHDIRELQEHLASIGLSSLGRAEAHVLATVEDVLALVAAAGGHHPPARTATLEPFDGRRLLEVNARQLLGRAPQHRRTRIMVTLPSEAATDAGLVAEMCEAGMDVARINCAHDDEDAWRAMAEATRAATRADGGHALVAMDIAGPKLRTGPIRPGPRVVRIAPQRDPEGVVGLPARVWLHHHSLTSAGAPSSLGAAPSGAVGVPVDDAAWLARRRVGDRLEFVDRRGAPRRWDVVEAGEHGVVATATQTAYVATGLSIECPSLGAGDVVAVADLPRVELALRLAVGDMIELTRSLEPAIPTGPGERHRIGCTAPEVFEHVRPGDRIHFDDGRIAGVVVTTSPDVLVAQVTTARSNGTKLKADKGINLPDSELAMDALTPKDLADLDAVAGCADVVNVSFVRTVRDVADVVRALEARAAGDVGIVLKIENATAFEQLPELLLTAMRRRDVGVMIARGDLAVEVGFERLAEVQEEILWICEAAHVPVVWATQVLDSMARTGRPSRAEVTDAAMAVRAECVMLNKGPHVVDAIRALDSILVRMQQHQHKKRSLLRQLRSWSDHGRSDTTEA